MNLQQRQAPIDRMVVTALIEATPETWSAAEMVVERTDDGSNERMSISISNPDGQADVVLPTDEIYEALYALSDCFRSFGKIWSRVRYVIKSDEIGHWKFEANFDYR